MSRRFAIGFRLTDLETLLNTWQNREQLLGGLFWLSDGLYWLELDGEIVPQAHPDWIKQFPEHGHPAGIEYLVLRFFADIGEALGRWLDPLPLELADAVRRESWTPWLAALHAFLERLPEERSPESPDFRQAGQVAERWWCERRLDTGYLRAAPKLSIVSPGAEHLELTWDTRQQRIDGVLVMIQSHGRFSLPRPRKWHLMQTSAAAIPGRQDWRNRPQVDLAQTRRISPARQPRMPSRVMESRFMRSCHAPTCKKPSRSSTQAKPVEKSLTAMNQQQRPIRSATHCRPQRKPQKSRPTAPSGPKSTSPTRGEMMCCPGPGPSQACCRWAWRSDCG